MFKMIQSNHKGSSATGKRGREVSSGGEKNKCNEAETECRQTEEAEQRRTDRERERESEEVLSPDSFHFSNANTDNKLAQ